MSTISAYGSSYSSYGNYSSQGTQRKKPSEEEMFKKADSSGDGTIDQTEFSDLISKGPGADSLNAEELYSSFDTDGDGSLSQEEMSTGMKSLRGQMKETMDKMRFSDSSSSSESQKTERKGPPPPPSDEELFSKADSSEDGSIDATEFADFLSKGPNADSVNAEETFATFDTDGDGTLSSDEFSTGMKDMMASMPPPPPPHGSKEGSESDSESNSDLSSIMASLDSDGDGTIDSEELSSGFNNTQIQKMIAAYLQQMSSSYSTQTGDSVLSSLSA